MKINIGIIGCGHWGPNHIRIFMSTKDSNVHTCSDLDQDRLNAVKEIYSTVNTTKDYCEVIDNRSIDAVVVSTPTKTHYKIVKECLKAGKHVLCEKPFTYSVEEAEELIELAKNRKLILMIGHVFLFNSGIQKLKEYIDSGTIGKPYYIHSTRTNLGPIRSDVNVVYDLASHDIAIFNYLINAVPLGITAKGGSFLQNGIEDVAFISFCYPGNIISNIHVSWLDPQKVRRITVVGDKKMAVWNDLDNIEPIKLYDKGVVNKPFYNDFGEFQLLLRESDVLIPKMNMAEPLKAQDMYFLKCVKENKEPLISGGRTGAEVVKVLEAIAREIKKP